MTFSRFIHIIEQYRKCPKCGIDWKINDGLRVSLCDDRITITCSCGFHKEVDENNEEIKKDAT